MPNIYEQIALSTLPIALNIAGARLIARDSNATGSDDAIGQLLLAVAPIGTIIAQGGEPGANLTLKVMRAVEQVAKNYRLQVGDVS